LHQDLLVRGWATEADFVTALAVGQMSPGPTGLWSISLGYLTFGWLGAVLALAALSIPPLLILVVAALYSRLEMRPSVQNFTRGISLGVVGLTLAVGWSLAASSIVDWGGLVIMVAALALALSKRLPIIVVIGLAALAGILLYGRQL
jgi:chromate transporter